MASLSLVVKSELDAAALDVVAGLARPAVTWLFGDV